MIDPVKSSSHSAYEILLYLSVKMRVIKTLQKECISKLEHEVRLFKDFQLSSYYLSFLLEWYEANPYL